MDAGPLKRAVPKYLQDPLADAILRGEVKDGDVVRVDEGDGALAIGVGASFDTPVRPSSPATQDERGEVETGAAEAAEAGAETHP